jgi:hypothetical protein
MAIDLMVRDPLCGGRCRKCQKTAPKEDDVGARLFGIAVVMLAAVACEQQGLASAADVASRYRDSALKNDPAGIVRLVPKNFAARAEAEEKVRLFEPVRGGNLRVVFHPNDVTPNVVGVEFIDDASGFRDTIQVQRFGSTGWFLMLGHSTDPGPAYPTAQASR